MSSNGTGGRLSLPSTPGTSLGPRRLSSSPAGVRRPCREGLGTDRQECRPGFLPVPSRLCNDDAERGREGTTHSTGQPVINLEVRVLAVSPVEVVFVEIGVS